MAKPTKTTKKTTNTSNKKNTNIKRRKEETSKANTVNSISNDKDETRIAVIRDEIPDVSTLSPGDFLNYKKLCEQLKVPVKDGNSKKSQTNDWKRYFDYEKIGVKYLIHEIYDDPLEKEYKYPPNTIYIKYIETLLLSLLGNTKGNTLKISPQSLYRALGMINPRFVYMNRLDPEHRVEELQKKTYTEMTEFEVEHFFNRCKSKFSKVIKSAFNSLQRRMLIKYSEEYEYQVSECDEFGKSSIVTYIADSDDIEYILKVKRETLLALKCEDESQIYLRNLTLPYYNEINRRVRRERGWIGLYKIYIINYNKELSHKAYKSDQVQLQKYGLNDALIKFIDDQAVRNYEKNKYDDFQYPVQYVDTQHLLSQHLLKLKS